MHPLKSTIKAKLPLSLFPGRSFHNSHEVLTSAKPSFWVSWHGSVKNPCNPDTVKLNHQKVVAYISLSCNDLVRSIENNTMQNGGTYPIFFLLFSPFPLFLFPWIILSSPINCWMSQIHSLLQLSCQIRHHILPEFFSLPLFPSILGVYIHTKLSTARPGLWIYRIPVSQPCP